MTQQEIKLFKIANELQEIIIKRFKWFKSEQAHKDLGNSCCFAWIEKYGKLFKNNFNKNFKPGMDIYLFIEKWEKETFDPKLDPIKFVEDWEKLQKGENKK